MPKVTMALAAALAVLATGAASPAWALSQSRSCQTIKNGWTICLYSSGSQSTTSLNCRTVDGRTVCSGSDGLHCEASGGRPVCRGASSSRVEIYPADQRTDTAPSSPDWRWDEED